MQIQRCSSINSNARSNSGQNVNFKAVGVEEINNFYTRGITDSQIDRVIADLCKRFGGKNVALYTEGNSFGVKFLEGEPRPQTKPFNTQSKKDFVNEASTLGANLEKTLEVFA